MTIRLFALAALVLSSVGSANADPALQPVGKWVVGSGPTCIIHRDFGSVRKPIQFELRVIPTLDEVYLSVTDYGRANDDEFVPATVSFGPTQPPIHTAMEIYQIKDSRLRFSWFSLDKAQVEGAVGRSAIDLRSPGFMNLSLAIPDLPEGLAALNECETSELERWGLSRAAQLDIARWPQIIGQASKYVTDADYPRDAIIEMSTGVNSARVRVDTAGLPSDCALLETSHSDVLDQTLCTVLLRFRFRPATDRSGRPVQSFKALRFDWRIRS